VRVGSELLTQVIIHRFLREVNGLVFIYSTKGSQLKVQIPRVVVHKARRVRYWRRGLLELINPCRNAWQDLAYVELEWCLAVHHESLLVDIVLVVA